VQILPTSSFPDLRLASLSTHDGRHLPCWEAQGAIYHITFHLADSVPADELRAWQAQREELKSLAQVERRQLTADERELLKSVYNERVERYLASGYGACLLKDKDVQAVVRDVLTHDNGSRYALHAWCVMPNHLHALLGGLRKDVPLRQLLGEWKRILAHRINRLCGRKGPVWHEDSYTHIIRDADEYRHQLDYVWNNPEAAGLTSGYARDHYVPLAFL